MKLSAGQWARFFGVNGIHTSAQQTSFLPGIHHFVPFFAGLSAACFAGSPFFSPEAGFLASGLAAGGFLVSLVGALVSVFFGGILISSLLEGLE